MKESNESIPCIVQLVQEAPFPTDPMVIEAANCCCFPPFRSVTSRFCGLPSQRISLLGTESQQRLHGHAGTRDPAPRTDLSGLHLVHLPLHPPPAAAWAVPILCSTVQWCQAFFIFHGGTSCNYSRPTVSLFLAADIISWSSLASGGQNSKIS